MDWTLIVAAGSLELVILSSAIGITWRLSRVEVGLRAEFTKEVASLQAKVYQVEIWSRDEFVRKGSFELVVARLENTMQLMGTKIETAVDKMATRIENLTHN
jgi:hypothetical protein